ncbi:hypothetical protein BGX38DRAFT_1228091 [Terfezia claveryi]|nr:hypothetical protein BGX38DRAFT_1228091 [Terfezia claveryi]
MVLRPTSELDQDEGVSDTSIEISVAYQQKRVGEECLWLTVRYQAALNSLTAEDTLPAEPVTLTLYEVSAGDHSKNELHDWKGVMRSIYPSHANSGSKSTTNTNISCEEAIQTLEEWARLEENRVLRATHILRKSSHEFSGCWHAEAVLGTLRHLSQLDYQKTFPPAHIELAPFEHTFPNIGVSKRCCPVCVKLLSLLAPPSTSNDISDPSIVLSFHQNFYPSALPPYLPRGIAVKLLVWLEGLVRGAVGGLVMKRRLEKSKETAGSEEKVARAKSADSKGESPRKMVKRKRMKEPGLTDIMRQMGFVANSRVTE